MTRGDPMSPLRWTTKSLRHLAEELTRQGHPVSAPTVGRLLQREGFSLQANAKVTEGRRQKDLYERLKEDIERQASRMTSEIEQEYLRVRRDPANIHAMCEDYRAGASVDLDHDKADLDKKIACPVLVLWGAKAPMGRRPRLRAWSRPRGVVCWSRATK